LASPSRSPHELVAHGVRLRLSSFPGAAATPPILELSGELDLDTVPHIDRFLRRRLGPLYHQDHLVIDLAVDEAVARLVSGRLPVIPPAFSAAPA